MPATLPVMAVNSVTSGTEDVLAKQLVKPGTPFFTGTADYPTDTWEKSSMTDQTTPAGTERGYNPVFHSVTSGASFGYGNKGLLTYSPPLSPVTIELQGCINVKTIPSLGAMPWSDLVVALSEQLDECAGSKFQGMVFLAELNKTVAMIRNPFNLINPKAIRYFPKGITMAAASAGRSLKNAPNLWLEYRYGWKPMWMDVCNFAKAWTHIRTDSAYHTVKKVWTRFTSSQEVVAPVLPVLWPQGYNQAFWDQCVANTGTLASLISYDSGLVRIKVTELKAVGTVYCKQFRPLGELASFLDNIEYILQVGTWQQVRDQLWEVLPFSFVVDWFINFNNIWRLFADQRLLQVDVREVSYSLKSSLRFYPETLLCRPWALYRGDSVYAYTNPNLVDSNAHRRIVRGGNGRTTQYQRTLGFPPDSEKVFTDQGLSILHGIDSISLLFQKLKYGPKTIYRR
jgi:hypothetical protein